MFYSFSILSDSHIDNLCLKQWPGTDLQTDRAKSIEAECRNETAINYLEMIHNSASNSSNDDIIIMVGFFL